MTLRKIALGIGIAIIVAIIVVLLTQHGIIKITLPWIEKKHISTPIVNTTIVKLFGAKVQNAPPYGGYEVVTELGKKYIIYGGNVRSRAYLCLGYSIKPNKTVITLVVKPRGIETLDFSGAFSDVFLVNMTHYANVTALYIAYVHNEKFLYERWKICVNNSKCITLYVSPKMNGTHILNPVRFELHGLIIEVTTGGVAIRDDLVSYDVCFKGVKNPSHPIIIYVNYLK
ncbi:MAG: hypothetical protein GXO26_06840 [Crenarchaeota archaeon]|nr:hypothetical protein [Thermoproteota archaeon]